MLDQFCRMPGTCKSSPATTPTLLAVLLYVRVHIITAEWLASDESTTVLNDLLHKLQRTLSDSHYLVLACDTFSTAMSARITESRGAEFLSFDKSPMSSHCWSEL